MQWRLASIATCDATAKSGETELNPLTVSGQGKYSVEVELRNIITSGRPGRVAKPIGSVLKSYEKAAAYARQKGVTGSTDRPGWGFKVTPKQRRRLERTHAEDMRRLVRGAHRR